MSEIRTTPPPETWTLETALGALAALRDRCQTQTVTIERLEADAAYSALAAKERHEELQRLRADFELSPEKLDEFERLRSEGGFETRKDLLNNAITLMKWAIKHAREGHAVAAVDEKAQKYFELEMPFLAHVTSLLAERGT